MSEKIDSKDLFVGCCVEERDFLIEPFIQYESFGKEFHEVRINPKKRLIMRVVENDEERYLDVATGTYFRPVHYSSSYYSDSSPFGTIYGYYVAGIANPGIGSIVDKIKETFNSQLHQIGYLVPFAEYIQNTLGANVDKISLSSARALVTLTNLTQPRKFVLSENEKIAEEQLNSKVYRKK